MRASMPLPPSLLLLAAVPLAAARREVFQARQSSSNGTMAATTPSQVEKGVQTECKVCPYEQCVNAAAYLYEQDLTLTCWTTAETIVDTDTWYKTTDGCFVTEWDIVEGNYTSVLSYCGDVEETYTQGPSSTVFNTECNIIPEFVTEPADHTRMYAPQVDLTITCSTNDGDAVLGNTRWYKTLSNCYVPEAQIEFVDAELDDCGPIPFLEAKMRQPDVAEGSEAVARRDVGPGAQTQREEKKKRWLYLTQIGEDEADCLSEADSTSEPARAAYPFGEYVVVQCATYSQNPADESQIYLLTEDFCWVNDTLTDPELVDDSTRAMAYPNCNLFVDTSM